MNKKGFTVIELVTTFALTSVIIILLINVILVIKNLYSNTNVKTELYINQSNLSNIMNSKINHDNLISYDICSDSEFCYIFSFKDGTSSKLVVTQDKISFGEFVYKLNSGTQVDSPKITRDSILNMPTTVNDSLLIIKIPIKCSLYPDIDFGINLVYQYNSSKTSL